MSQTLESIGGICTIVLFVLLVVVVLIRWFQRTKEDRTALAVKLVVTLLLLGFTFGAAVYLHGGYGFVIWPFIAVFCGIVFSVIWTPSIGSWFAELLTSEIDGGSEPPELKPFYSVARGLRARGKYVEAAAEVERQLEKFPGDFEGQLLLAEIQVTNLHDLQAAETTVGEICNAANQTAQNIAAALNTLADWHLKIAKDHEAARRDLERIVGLCPGSEAALGAAQRIGHLGAEEKPWVLRERKKIFVPEGVKNYGLVMDHVRIAPEAAPEKLTMEYVAHLEQHPLDTEAREKLAVLYADHYRRLDLAVEQLEQLIAQPNAPMHNVMHWLNLLADLHIRSANDYEAAKQALQRIVDRFPTLAPAQLAQNRIELLRLELKVKEKSEAVKLGSYEQNIGLKYGLPRKL